MVNIRVALILPIVLSASISSCYGASLELSVDIEDPDELLSRLRVERDDYAIGGPLAKSGKNGQPASPSSPSASSSKSSNANPAPAPAAAAKPAPAAQPSPAAPATQAPAPAPSPPESTGGRPASGPSSDKNDKPAETGSENQTPPKPTSNEGAGNGGGGAASAGGKGSACPMSVIPSSVLSDIAYGKAQLPEYNHKFTDTCKISECAKICEKSSCNYFMRSSSNGLSYFYVIQPEKLSQPNFTESVFYDSFVPQCASGGSLENANPPSRHQQQQQPADSVVKSQPPSRSRKTDSGSNGQTPNRPLAKQSLSPEPPIPLPAMGEAIGGGSGDRCPECLAKDAFKRFLQMNNKTFANPYDEENHLKFFQDGLARIKELNAKARQAGDAIFGQTKFTDTPFGDFVKKFTGGIKETNPAPKFDEDISSLVEGLPIKFDWRDEGVVPDVRYQKECGSCYAFSTSDLTATQWAIDHGEKRNYVLAPQYVLDCVHEKSAFGCDGGRPYLVLSTNANCTGSNCAWPRESCYPYRNEASKTCLESDLQCVQSEKPNIQVKQAHYLDVSGSGGQQEKQRLSALLQGGPVVALVTVTDHWQYYTGGIMRADQCQSTSETPNHAVLIVGYDFSDPAQSYYIIKNTWDTDWGEKGYFRMEAGTNACGVAQFLSFACTKDCGDGKSSKNLLERSKKKLQEKGILLAATTPSPQAYQQPTTAATKMPGTQATAQAYAAPKVSGWGKLRNKRQDKLV